jgi:hypothetical protein
MVSFIYFATFIASQVIAIAMYAATRRLNRRIQTPRRYHWIKLCVGIPGTTLLVIIVLLSIENVMIRVMSALLVGTILLAFWELIAASQWIIDRAILGGYQEMLRKRPDVNDRFEEHPVLAKVIRLVGELKKPRE